jgi:hypothetical protein
VVDPQDRRGLNVGLPARGLAATRAQSAAAARIDAELAARVGEPGVAALRRRLAALIDIGHGSRPTATLWPEIP